MSIMVPGGEESVVVPAEDRFAMSLEHGGQPIPARPAAAPAAAPAPATPAPAAPAPVREAASVHQSIEQLNRNMMAIVDEMGRTSAANAEAARAAAAAPDPIEALLTHPDEEVRALAKANKEMRDTLARIEQRSQQTEAEVQAARANAFEQEILAQQTTVMQVYGLNVSEMDAVMERWGDDCTRDQRLAVLSVDEAVRRYVGTQALDARRAARPPAPGEGLVPAPTAPRIVPRTAPGLMTETASGGGRQERIAVNGGMSNHDITKLALRERFGQ